VNVFILGSCVTRDIFRVVGKEKVVDYFARTTLISLMSHPLPIEEINLNSEFQKRIVKRDFDKNFFEELKKANFDFLIIDFIDERFNVLKYSDSYITRSSEFVNAGLDDSYDFEPVNKNTDEYKDNWKKAADLFIKKLKTIVPNEKVILHEAYWAQEYIDNNEIKSFDNQKYIQSNNEMLKEYYQYFKESMPLKVVKADSLYADVNHVWGLSPFHYTDEYYFEIYKQLQRLNVTQ